MEDRRLLYFVTSAATFVLALFLVVITLLGVTGVLFNLDAAYTLETSGLYSFDWLTSLSADSNVFAWVAVGVSGVSALAIVMFIIVTILKVNVEMIPYSILTMVSTLVVIYVSMLLGNVNVNSLGTLQDYAINALAFDSSVGDYMVCVFFYLVAILFVATVVMAIVTYICLFRVESLRHLTREERKARRAERKRLRELKKRGKPLPEPAEGVVVEEKPKRKVVLSIKRHPRFDDPAPFGPAPSTSPTLDEIREVIKQELQGQQKTSTTTIVYEGNEVEISKDGFRRIVNEELRDVLALLRPNKTEQVIVKEVKEEVPVSEKVEEKEEEPASNTNIEVHVEAPVEVEAPVVEVQTEEDEDVSTKKVVRVSFAQRMLQAEDDIREHYNNLKSLLKSYGLKNRVSNGGDTFRLHRVTYCKITIAGKALKLYLALDPQDYANTTLPIKDSSSKAIYRDIPLTFKVKSELSYRRAEQLIRDCMEKHNVEQIDQVYAVDWASKVEEEANLTDESNDEE